MKKTLVFLLLLFLITGCSSIKSDNSTETESHTQEITNILSEQYYMGNIDYAVQVIRFNADEVIEWIDCGLARAQDKRTKYYGTYEIDGRKLTISLSGQDDMNCVIHEDRDSITIDGITFSKIKDINKLSEETLKKFD